jgi:Ca2+-binding RTX toxin-like protein
MMLRPWILAVVRAGTDGLVSHRRRPRVGTLRPQLDELEPREFPAGGIALVTGTVMIQASGPFNSAVVSYTDASQATIAVSWNGTVADFSTSAVTGIMFEGQTGFVDEFQNLTGIASTAIGGNGTNVFVGESGEDTFIGGNGFNLFWVAGGNDTLVGGGGANLFIGVSGNDTATVGPGSNATVIP